MISIDIIDRDRNKTYKLDIPTDITIKEMSDRFCKIAGLGGQNVLYHFCGEILRFNKRISDYGIEDMDVIICHRRIVGGSDFHLYSYKTEKQIHE